MNSDAVKPTWFEMEKKQKITTPPACNFPTALKSIAFSLKELEESEEVARGGGGGDTAKCPVAFSRATGQQMHAVMKGRRSVSARTDTAEAKASSQFLLVTGGLC